MGMFTSIIHPDDGRELQIKTGADACDTYNVGDDVKWYVDPKWAFRSALLDGIYDSYSDRDDDWVVIKDHKVHCIIPIEEITEEKNYFYYKEKFEIEDHDHLWSDEVLKKHNDQEEKIKKEFDNCKTEEEAMMLFLSKMTLNYGEIGRKLFPIQELEGKIVYMDYADKKQNKNH